MCFSNNLKVSGNSITNRSKWGFADQKFDISGPRHVMEKGQNMEVEKKVVGANSSMPQDFSVCLVGVETNHKTLLFLSICTGLINQLEGNQGHDV